MPMAPAAFSMGTAKPMPMNTCCSVGFSIAVTIPTTSPSVVTSGPPELPGLTAASNWMRLVSAGRSLASYSRRNPDTTPCDTGGRAQGRGGQVIRQLLRLQYGKIVLGANADHLGLGLGAILELDFDLV